MDFIRIFTQRSTGEKSAKISNVFRLYTTVGTSTMYTGTKKGLSCKWTTCCICWRKQYITYWLCRACVCCVVVSYIVRLWRERGSVRVSLKPADAAELRLIRPSGWWQQVGSCGDFVNLYLRASREDRQTHRHTSTRAKQLNNILLPNLRCSFPICVVLLGVKKKWSTMK